MLIHQLSLVGDGHLPLSPLTDAALMALGAVTEPAAASQCLHHYLQLSLSPVPSHLYKAPSVNSLITPLGKTKYTSRKGGYFCWGGQRQLL